MPENIPTRSEPSDGKVSHAEFDQALGMPDEQFGQFISKFFTATTSSSFQTIKAVAAGDNLAADELEPILRFAEFINKSSGATTSSSFETAQAVTAPNKLVADALEPILKFENMSVKLIADEASNLTQRFSHIGPKRDIAMTQSGLSAFSAKADINELQMPANTCISCQSPASLHQSYACSDLTSPEQVRGSQLERMFFSLHEIGHLALFPGLIAAELRKPDMQDLNPMSPLSALGGKIRNERHADVFAAAVMIHYLGDEGVGFARQIAAGIRYVGHGTNEVNDTAIAIAKLLEEHAQDPLRIQQSSLAELLDNSVRIANSLKGTAASPPGLSLVSQSFGSIANSPSVAYTSAQERLTWYGAHPKGEVPTEFGGFVDTTALDFYNRYVKPADKLMLPPEELERNLRELITLGRFDSGTVTGPTGQAAAQQCETTRRRPGVE